MGKHCSWIAAPRSGVTLLELLVAIGILALLAALLLPAVQNTRYTARRLICANHLHQVGVGMAGIVDTTGKFPTASQPESAHRRLLPYLDATSLADTLASGGRPDSMTVPAMGCPDDPIMQHSFSAAAGNSNYFLNQGTVFRAHDPTNGFRKSATADVSPAEITDGLSQTVAMSERLLSPSRVQQVEDVLEREPGRYLWWTETRFRGRGEEPLAIENCRHHRTTPVPQVWTIGNPAYVSGDYDHMLPPNHHGCYNGPEDFDVDLTLSLVPASSLHSGGVNSLLADGSVHFVSESIDPGVWQALGTRNGREAVASPF